MCIDDNKYQQNASDLLKSLKDVYSTYTQADRDEKTAKQRMTRLFKGWFASLDSQAVQPIHQEFLNEVERIVTELASVLERIHKDSPESCRAYAEQALDLMLAPKPIREKTTADWYLMISEYQCLPLLPYSSSDKLQLIRNMLLKRAPKRLMLPKQRELIETIETIIRKPHN